MAKRKPLCLSIEVYVSTTGFTVATVFTPKGWEYQRRARSVLKATEVLWPYVADLYRPDLEIGWHFNPKSLSAGLLLPKTVGEGPPRKIEQGK